jgi:hypothetical protein
MRSLLLVATLGVVGAVELAGCTTSGAGSTGSPPAPPPASDSTAPTSPGAGPARSPVAPGSSGPSAPVTIPSGRVTLEVRPLIGPPAPVRCGSGCSGDPFAALSRAGVAIPTTAAGFAKLPTAQQHEVTTALGRAECTTTGRQHGPYLVACDRGQNTGSRLAFLLGEPVFGAADVRAATAMPPSPAQGATEWTVLVQLTRSARTAFATWTAAHNTGGRAAAGPVTACAPTGTPCADYLAVVVDGRVLTNPYNSSPVTGGVLQLAAGFTETSAKRLAAGLP